MPWVAQAAEGDENARKSILLISCRRLAAVTPNKDGRVVHALGRRDCGKGGNAMEIILLISCRRLAAVIPTKDGPVVHALSRRDCRRKKIQGKAFY